MKLVLVRHLPTPWNLGGILQGDADVLVDKVSIADAIAIQRNIQKHHLHNVDFTKVLTSELERTQQTAKAYGFTEYETSPLINELNFGSFQGKPKIDMLAELGSEWETGFGTNYLIEQVAELKSRIVQLMNSFEANDVVCIFGHGAFFRALMAYTQNGTISEMNKQSILHNQVVILEQ